jgi:hypothetical protein
MEVSSMNQLLDLAIEAHGGLERWRATERLDVGLPDITRDRLWTER